MAMYKFSVPLVSVLLVAVACDSEAVDTDTQRAAERPQSELVERASMAVGMFCMKLDCSEQQRSELTAIAHSALPDEEQRARHEQAMHRFAEAFRADEFNTEVVVALHREHAADREHMRDSFLAAHQVLDATQREELAGLVESGFGPPPMMKTRHASPAAVADHMAARLCEVAACDEDQQAAIAAAIADGAPKPSEDAISTMKSRFAAVLRTEDLDAKTLDELAREMENKRAAFQPRALDTLAEVHSMLEPEQRDAVATTLEREGPHGLMGPGAMHR
jgi:hypothetical protein